MARKGCHCKACNEGTTQSCSIEKLLYIYIFFLGCKKFGRPGSTRVWTWLLSDILYRFMTGVSTSLLCVFRLPANDLTYPCKVVVQRFWAALLTAMCFKDVAQSRKLNISNGAFCQVACLPKYGEHHLCEPQTWRKDRPKLIKPESDIWKCSRPEFLERKEPELRKDRLTEQVNSNDILLVPHKILMYCQENETDLANDQNQKLVPLGNPLTDSKQMPSIPRNCNAYPLSDRRW